MQPQSPSNIVPDDETLDQLALVIASKVIAEASNTGYSETQHAFLKLDWKYLPVTPYEFLMSDDYMGKFGAGLYPKWVDELQYVLDPSNNITEWILSGAIGIGKSTIAALAMAYKIYRISCLKNPANFFGLMEESAIVFGIYSLFKYKAQDDNFGNLKVMIDGCPYFRDVFPRAKMKSKGAADDLDFPNRIGVLAGSTELHAIGLNLLGLICDEVNFMKQAKTDGPVDERVGQAHKLYNASKRRLESRFAYRGQVPGLMIMISSRNSETSWLETHMDEVRDQPSTHISDFPLWEIKPKQNYKGERFFIEVGDSYNGSRVLTKLSEKRAESKVIAVPVEHKAEFDRDIEGALRDIAGVASVSAALLFRDREALRATISPKLFHPFTRPYFSISTNDQIRIEDFFSRSTALRVERSITRPILNPNASRFIHVDLAETGDSAGICMGHAIDTRGNLPFIAIDFVLCLSPPKESWIDFSKIREFILFLRGSCGYRIKRVSFDRFQSTDSRQILAKMGFETPHVSVDKTDEAYLTLKQVIYEGRLLIYDYPILFAELASLIHYAEKRKVDHPLNSTKDVADSLASVVWQLSLAMGDVKKGVNTESTLILPQYSADADTNHLPPVPARAGRLV